MKTYSIIRCLSAAVLVTLAAPVWAEDAPAASTAKTPDQRQAEAAKRKAEYEKLTPEQREAHRKQRQEKMAAKLAELQKKKADGTITTEEQKRLDRLEAFKANGGAPGAARKHAAASKTDKPAVTDATK